MKKTALIFPCLAIALASPTSWAAPQKEQTQKNRVQREKSKREKPSKKNVVTKRSVTEEDLDAMDSIKTFFNRGYRIEESLATLKEFATVDILKDNKLLTPTIKLLENPTVSRSQRIGIFDFLFELLQPEGDATNQGEESDQLLEDLIKSIKDIRSPMLSSHMLQSFYGGKDQFHEDALKDLIDLQNDILEDMISLPSSQKFNHQDYMATMVDLKKSKDEKSKKLIVKAMVQATEKDVPQNLRIHIFEAIAALSITMVGQEPHFSLLETKTIFSNTIKLLKKANQTFRIPEEVIPEDIKELEAILMISENLMGDPSQSRGREDAFKELSNILKVNEPTLSRMTGDTLINAQIISFHNRLSPFKLAPVLLKNIQKRAMDIEQLDAMANQLKTDGTEGLSGEQQKHLKELQAMKKQALQLNNSALELATRYTLVLISTNNSRFHSNLVSLMQELKDQFYTQNSLEAKVICLKAFANLDLGLVQSKYFPLAAVKVLDQFFENCFQVLEVQMDEPKLEEVQLEISDILSEMTGSQIGPYPKRWRQWRKSPLGKRFFKRLPPSL